jgi:hypothetical protein
MVACVGMAERPQLNSFGGKALPEPSDTSMAVSPGGAMSIEAL